MKKLAAIIVLASGLCLTANADVWKWIDVYGETHYVSTMTTIYTWLDEEGKVHYSDKPEHADAISVELVWVSSDVFEDEEGFDGEGAKTPKKMVDPNESEFDRLEREAAEAYYCKRAKQIYDSYMSAPNLYKTTADGEKEYLSEAEAAATLADTEAKVAELCE